MTPIVNITLMELVCLILLNGQTTSLRCWDCYSAKANDPCFTGQDLQDERIETCIDDGVGTPACLTWKGYGNTRASFVLRYCGLFSESSYDQCTREDDSIICGCTTDLCTAEEPHVVPTTPQKLSQYHFATPANDAPTLLFKPLDILVLLACQSVAMFM